MHRQVCPVDSDWVAPLVERLRNVNVKRLSGGATTAAEVAVAQGELTNSTPLALFLLNSSFIVEGEWRCA